MKTKAFMPHSQCSSYLFACVMVHFSRFVQLLVIFLFLGLLGFSQDLNYLFKPGDEGYRCFRIPAVVATKNGTLLAFAEARTFNCGDAGDIDLVVKRSEDGGKTWSKLMLVWDDGANTCGNPAPVVDQKTGKVVLLSTWNLGTDHEPQIINGTSKDTRRIFVLSSVDDGISWSAPKEVTKDVKLPEWTWYATGPGNGIQIRSGKYKGRLVVPCDHIEAGSKKYFSHTIHSDDGGLSWTLGGTTPADGVNESTVAELPKGVLLLNMRNYSPARIRQTSVSKDGGASWSALQGDSALIEPVCQASMLWYNHKGRKPFLAFANPASAVSRTNMTVRISYDKGKTWALSQTLHNGPSAYSNLVILPNGNLACYFEAGKKGPYEGIVFQELSFTDFK